MGCFVILYLRENLLLRKLIPYYTKKEILSQNLLVCSLWMKSCMYRKNVLIYRKISFERINSEQCLVNSLA